MRGVVLDERTVVRCTWCLTLLVFVGVGVGIVWWPSSQKVDAFRSAAAAYYDEANRNEEQVAHAALLRTVQTSVVSDLRTLAPVRSSAAATASMLALLSSESKSYNVTVKSVIPQAVQNSPPFDKTPLEIALGGRFADVLHFVSDLPRHDALLEIEDVSFSQPVERDGTLAATLHATLYRYRGTLPWEDDRVSTAL